jgi:hypothetical protein
MGLTKKYYGACGSQQNVMNKKTPQGFAVSVFLVEPMVLSFTY